MTKIATEKVLVLDFGSQYAQLIARRVRQQQVYCEIVRHDISAQRIGQLAPKGLILSGGPSSVYEAAAPKCDPQIFHLGLARAGHLLRHATGLRGPRRPRGKRSGAGVRPGPLPAGERRRAIRRRARGFAGLDEPRRPGLAGLGRFSAAGRDRHLPLRRGEAQFAAGLRPAIPSRGHAHAAGAADPGQLPQGDLQVLGQVEDRRLRPRDDRDHPRSRGQGPGDLRSFRRGR